MRAVARNLPGRRAGARAGVPAVVLGALALTLAGCGGGGAGSASSTPVTVSDEATSPVLDYRLEGWSKTDFSKHAVPFDEFRGGGPPKDGIPAITVPVFASVANTRYLEEREPVIELVVRGEARAYPLQIMVWHEIVDDVVADVPVAVTFCPLCNTAIAFDRRVGGKTLTFSTTGKLRHSDLVMYDRETESWWQQFGGQAIVGTYTGTELTQLPARMVAWGEFKTTHPRGLVLTRGTGYARDYGRNPYEGYDDINSPPIFATAGDDDGRLPPKERVVFIVAGPEAVAIPFSALAKKRLIRVEAGGRRFDVRWRPGVASALDSGQIASGRDVGAATVLENGKPVAFDEPFWFAVAAFRPDVRIVTS